MQKDLLKAKETLYRLAANVKLLPDRSVIKTRRRYSINLSAVGDGSDKYIVGKIGKCWFCTSLTCRCRRLQHQNY